MRPYTKLVPLAFLACMVGDSAAFVVSSVPFQSSQSNKGLSSPLCATREASFAMGCFWKPSEELLKVDGVLETTVGYTGVANPAKPPTYDTVCFSRDWVEGVRVLYDDQVISYAQLLDAFFETQEPKVGSRQYGSIIFPHDAEQEQVAQAWLVEHESRVREDGLPAFITQVEALTPFFRAENYHQEYWQKTRPRLAGAVALIAVASGALNNITPVEFQSQVHTAANGVFFAGALFVLAERFLDNKVVLL